MLDMILGTFIQLTDKILQVLKNRQESRESVFKEIVEPLFRDFEPLADNYHQLFRRAGQVISSGSEDEIDAFAREIEGLRGAMLTARQKVREMAGAIRDQVKDEKIADLTDQMDGYFFSSYFPQIGPRGAGVKSLGHELVDLFRQHQMGFYSNAQVAEFVSAADHKLSEAWNAIAKSYASLRLDYLAGDARKGKITGMNRKHGT